MGRDKVIVELQEEVRKLTMELGQIKGTIPLKRWGQLNWELDVSHIDIAYSSSHEDYDVRVEELGEEDFQEMSLVTPRSSTPKFDGNLKQNIVMKSPSSLLSSRRKGIPLFNMNIQRRIVQEKLSRRLRHGPNSRSTWTRDSYLPHTSKSSTSRSVLLPKRISR